MLKLVKYAALVAMTSLVACGEENSTSKTSMNAPSSDVTPVDRFARDLIRENGCDPRIANAMAPFESDFGECRMPKFLDVCGTENLEAGILLIGDVRETSGGLNPWAWACARRMEPKTALVAACQYRFGSTSEVCTCSVSASYAEEEDIELLEWLAFTEANDPQGQTGKFKTWSTLGESNRWEDLTELRSRHYKRLEKCMG